MPQRSGLDRLGLKVKSQGTDAVQGSVRSSNISPRRQTGTLANAGRLRPRALLILGLLTPRGNHLHRRDLELTLPIIDVRNYLDDVANIHTRIRTFAKLDRLQMTNGTIANEVNWLTANVGTIPNLARMALIAHNEWLERIRTTGPAVRNRPFAARLMGLYRRGVVPARSLRRDSPPTRAAVNRSVWNLKVRWICSAA